MSRFKQSGAVAQWLEARLPILGLGYSAPAVSPISTPRNLELLVPTSSAPSSTCSAAGGADRDRGDPGHALHPQCRPRLQLRRAHHARRELRLAAALPAFQRRLDVLPRRLYPHVPRHVLRLLQVAARGAVDPRRHHLSRDDGDRLHGLRAAVGPDELLGGDRHHQPVLGHSGRRRAHRDVAVGRFLGRQSHPEPVLLAALPPAIRHSRRRGAAYLGAPRGRAEQSRRHRSPGREGHRGLHALCHSQGHLRAGGIQHRLCVVRIRDSELSRPRRQLHSRQSRGDALAYRAGMVLPAVLCDPALDPEQAARRDGPVRLDRHSRLPAVARHLAGALGDLSAALSAILLDLRHRMRRLLAGWLGSKPRGGRLRDRSPRVS